MRYFKDTSGKVFGVDDDQDHLIKPDWVLSEKPQPAPPTARSLRDQALAALVHDFGDGRVIQVRQPPFAADESNIRNAIEQMNRMGQDQRLWRMVDNTDASVTINDLQTALNSAQEQVELIWGNFRQEVVDD